MAGIAVLVWLADVYAPATALAGPVAVLFAVLALMAAIAGAFGRGRDGLYAPARAAATVGESVAVLALGFVWVEHGWSAADAGRVLDASAVKVAELVTR